MLVMRAKTVPTTRAVTMVTIVTMATMAGMVTIAKMVRTGTIAIMVTISRTVATSRTANVQNGYNGHDKFFVPRQTGKEMVYSWGCLSSPSAVQTYDLQRACLEDLYNCTSLADNQAGGTLPCKGICDGSPSGPR